MTSQEIEMTVDPRHPPSTVSELDDAIRLLTEVNRRERRVEIDRALVRLRRQAGGALALEARVPPAPLPAREGDGQVMEVDAADLTVAAVRDGWATCGCLLVRGLISPARADHLRAGMDAALAAYDEAIAGSDEVDPGWYDPLPMPDRSASGMTDEVHRAFLRGRGAMWTADSPRMLFDLLAVVDECGLGALMTELLGERPVLSGIKGTMRRVPPDIEVDRRWHQDGSFLGADIRALNLWLALTPCGRDAPGLDLVPKRIEHVVPRDAEARFDWSLSDVAVREASRDAPVVRPEFAAGDALLFDHLLVHRTGASPDMRDLRYAIESWFFAPSGYPADQLPIRY